jgi:hypothetical protein
MPPNALDKTTIFSIYSKTVDEKKITVFPTRFIIPAGTPEKPSSLVVGPSSWWKEIHESDQLLEIPQHSAMMAKSIVDDYCSGIFGYIPGISEPGLFWIPGELTVAEAKKQHGALFQQAEQRQREWYLRLVQAADSLWSRTNMSPSAISDDMRRAARELKLDTKEWLTNFQAVELTKCVACGSARNPAFPVCPTCKHVDKAKAKELGLAFAE